MKKHTVRTILVTVCAALIAVILLFLCLLFLQSCEASQPVQSTDIQPPVEPEPVLPQVHGWQGVMLSAADVTEELDALQKLGCHNVVVDLRDLEDFDLLVGLCAQAKKRSMGLYGIYPIFSDSQPIVPDEEGLSVLTEQALTFARQFPDLSGVIAANCTLSDTDALYPLYHSEYGSIGFEEFLATIEQNTLRAVQEAFKMERPDWMLGTLTRIDTLDPPAFASPYNNFLLIEAPYADGTISYDALNLWHTYARLHTAVPIYPIYPVGTSISSLTASQQELTAYGLDTGYLLQSIPAEEETVDSATDPSDETETDLSITERLEALTAPADVTPIYPEETLYSDKLILNRPTEKNGSGTASVMPFTGIVPVGAKVSLDGVPVETDAYGHFHADVPLYMGYNIIYLRVDDAVYTFYYTRYAMNVTTYSPMYSAVLDGGTEIPVWIRARSGATVTASLSDQTVPLTPNEADGALYQGTLVLPEGGEEAQSLGSITFRVRHNGSTQTVTGGAITVNLAGEPDEQMVTLSAASDKYKDNGTTRVYPIVPYGAHEPDLLDFNAADYANWDYFPLPNGTKDYVVGNPVAYAGVQYYHLRSGVRVAVEDTTPCDDLLRVNRIHSLVSANDGAYTTLALQMDWPVAYTVDVIETEIAFTFSDTVSVPENLPLEKTPLFTAANWDGSTLTLPFRIENGFLGYTARYDAQNRLILSFTNPPESGSIVGANITIDPGHGGFGDPDGTDVGAVGAGMLDEAQLNAAIGQYLLDYLQEIGADPLLTPAKTELLTVEERMNQASAHRSSMVVSIHHNSSTSTTAYGVGTYYFQDYSEPLSALVQEEVAALHNEYIGENLEHDDGLYHTRYLFTLRSGWVSLMLENGFVCHGDSYEQLVSSEFQAEIALAITRAIARYYERFAPVANWQTGMESTLQANFPLAADKETAVEPGIEMSGSDTQKR